MTTKRYFLLRYFPEPGLGFPILRNGQCNPAFITECNGSPIGIRIHSLVDLRHDIESLLPDPLERAVIMTQGIIGEYAICIIAGSNCYILKRAWRVKKHPYRNLLVRGHQLRIP